MLNRARTRFSIIFRVLPFFAAALTIAMTPADAHRRHHHGGRAMPASLTDPEKDAALIEDGATGKVLYSRNANALRHPASLTKMMTLYLLFEALKKGQITLASTMPVSAHAAAQKPTKLHLYAGDAIPVEAAIYAIVVRSANDVAVTIAEALGGTESHFAEMMTAKARQLGMKNTFYHNASGLPDSLQITTASDLAILARHLAYDFPQYFHYFSAPGFTYRGQIYRTHDNLIGRYDGADGIKTGYTEASGFNLATSVTRGRNHVVAIVMGGRTAHRRDREMVNLLDNVFAEIRENPTLVASVNVPWKGTGQPASTMVAALSFNSQLPDQSATPVGAGDADDEDAAENRQDDDPDSQNEIAPPPTPVPATPRPQQAQPQTAIADNAPVPTPKPAAQRPVQVASYQPSAPKPMARPDIGQGDYDDQAIAAKKLTAQDWTIQIGAFADSGTARQQLASYAERSMDILGQAARIIVPFRSVDGQTLFRARFGPFLEREAREICAQLTQRGQTCFAALATR